MNRLQINIIILFSIFFITSCSYEPIFSQKNYNIKLEKYTLSGDKDVNKIIEDQLSLFKRAENGDKKTRLKSENDEKKYSVDITSKLEKNVFSKDSKGDPQKFEKTLNVTYKVFYNVEMVLKKEIESKYVYNNESDKFKLEQSEKIIIENLSEKISETIISSIINLNDN